MNAKAENISTELAIELSDLTKRFGSTLAVDNLSLSVEQGSTFGLIRPSLVGFCSFVLVAAGVVTVAAYLGVPVKDMFNKEGHEIAIRWSAMTGLSHAVVCFCIGTWDYVRRREP